MKTTTAANIIEALLDTNRLIPFHGFTPENIPAAHKQYLLNALLKSDAETIILTPALGCNKLNVEKGIGILHMLHCAWKGNGVFFDATTHRFSTDCKQLSYGSKERNEWKIEIRAAFDAAMYSLSNIVFYVHVWDEYTVSKTNEKSYIGLDREVYRECMREQTA